MRLLRNVMKPAAVAVAVWLLLPVQASAQTGSIAGQARDESGGALPGVIVEVTSPALIEKVRSATTDENGRYRITVLPVGTYEVTFTLPGFNTYRQGGIVLTSDVAASVNGQMTIGEVREDVTVVATATVIDVQNARQQVVLMGEDIRDLPTGRNLPDLLTLVPGFTTPRGTCSGGVGTGTIGSMCDPNIRGFSAHADASDTTAMGQGRVLVDGIIINSGRGVNAFDRYDGVTGGYIADVAGAQEISFSLSGALGESETGGASINIVPKTGGNRYAGNYFTSYSNGRLFDRNNADHPHITVNIPVVFDYDVNGSYGGPILRDRLWFQMNARHNGKKNTLPEPIYWNLSYGQWGRNYEPDRSRDALGYRNEWKNANIRLTLQASARNKFNIFWDEQSSCLDPCYGVLQSWTSPESWQSTQTYPNRLMQLSWTNPMTSRLLFEAGISVTLQHYDTSRHREIEDPSWVPRIFENGVTKGIDAVSWPAGLNNQTANLLSGSKNDALGAGGFAARMRNSDTVRTRGSVSYITGSHNAKIGYETAHFMDKTTNKVNDPRLSLRFQTPAVACAETLTCGNTSLYYPQDPDNTFFRRPVPDQFTINTGVGTLDERVSYGAVYIQDQWTIHRFTLSGALRYDHAESGYGATCIGGSGTEPFVPVQNGGAYDGQRRWCTEPSDGVSYNDITPRWGVAWDVFGNGKTAIKWNMGKYLTQASFSGLYSDVNPAVRSSNSLARSWDDTNGNRIPDCRYFDFDAHDDLGDTCGAITSNASNRYGRDPYALDAAGLNASFFTTTYCGRAEMASPQVQAYCDASGFNLVNGWGARRYEWQFGLGVQHELLPRLSVEVTYNRRSYGNITSTDILGRGCDRFGFGALPEQECQQNYLDHVSDGVYDFYSVVAPLDPRLPGGGGYTIFNANQNRTNGTMPDDGTAVAFAPKDSYTWAGVDTNVVWRGFGGLRVSGGTSMGRTARNTCFSALTPDIKGREGNPSCAQVPPLQTNVRASASYTIPWVDVLLSTVYQYRPGPQRSANLQFDKDAATWIGDSTYRATAPCTVQSQPTTGCFYGGSATNTQTINLLDTGDLYGEGLSLIDLKFSKNIRFANRRINVGVDVYNLLNSDTIVGYNNNYTAWRDPATGEWYQGLGVEGGRDNPATAAVETQNWGRSTSLTSPRFMRVQLQFDF